MCADWFWFWFIKVAYIMGVASPNDACSAPLGAVAFRKVAYIMGVASPNDACFAPYFAVAVAKSGIYS